MSGTAGPTRRPHGSGGAEEESCAAWAGEDAAVCGSIAGPGEGEAAEATASGESRFDVAIGEGVCNQQGEAGAAEEYCASEGVSAEADGGVGGVVSARGEARI